MSDEATRRAMDAVNRVFEEQVVGQGRFEALAEVYTRDALILPPGGEVVRGLEAIRGFWQQAAQALGVTACRLRPFETTMLGEMACEVAQGEIVAGSGTIPIKYVVLWKREDGAWKWHRDIWNASA
ncbi:hypothetical protein CR162_04880 [Pseudoroseomonas rhizosphaerae]|uniref:SnoaL-like domain-containing protein n=1 Tax=Teichococcus rhizosphaerae TaxID=1335062 RepID=A0A2C6ZCF4_9PROT|nr:nuclear transport factor 2 family protein [Pseudoroseomonas rhizosphaerae]PHK96171.1 hypothetical protein CR162_04880 [Pseudoroseomonas rhizosphaerae]